MMKFIVSYKFFLEKEVKDLQRGATYVADFNIVSLCTSNSFFLSHHSLQIKIQCGLSQNPKVNTEGSTYSDMQGNTGEYSGDREIKGLAQESLMSIRRLPQSQPIGSRHVSLMFGSRVLYWWWLKATGRAP